MLTFDLVYTTKMTIIFNGNLEMRMNGSMSEAIEKIKWGFQNYPFLEAEVIDTDTGELLITARNA